MLFFRDYFGAATTVRIYKRWGNNAIGIAKKNPYLLCQEIDGIGFERADIMAGKLGIPHDSPDRIKSGLCYVLVSNAAQNGHVCLPEGKLVPSAATLLGCWEPECGAALGELLKSGQLVSETRAATIFGQALPNGRYHQCPAVYRE